MIWILAGCIPQSGKDTATETGSIDILFLIDNSASMTEESIALGEGIGSFLSSEAVQAGDVQLALSTVTADISGGAGGGTDPGEAGLLLGGPFSDETDFLQALYCSAVYWDSSSVPSETDEGTDPTAEFTREYLDELCGAGWEDNAGSGNEEPLEAAFLSVCRGVEEPPESCFEPITAFASSDVGSNAGFPREDSEVLILVLTDEGDNSRRMQQGQSDPEAYIEAFEEFGRDIKVSAIGPHYDSSAEDGSCLNGAPSWSVERLQLMAEATGGMYMGITEAQDGNGSCPPADIAGLLSSFSDLLE